VPFWQAGIVFQHPVNDYVPYKENTLGIYYNRDFEGLAAPAVEEKGAGG
jgi:hypothetical protein